MAETKWNGRLQQADIKISASRSTGPGGQNVNKRSTKAEVIFEIHNSNNLSKTEAERLIKYLTQYKRSLLAGTTGAEYILMNSSEHRTFLRNKEVAIHKLEILISKALLIPKQRKKTKPTKGSIEKRITSKKKNSLNKLFRSKKNLD
jgi:ribosome-associated protein